MHTLQTHSTKTMKKILALPQSIVDVLKDSKLLVTATEHTRVMLHCLKQPTTATTHGAVVEGSYRPGEKGQCQLRPGCRGFLILNPVFRQEREVGIEYLYIAVTTIQGFELVATACEYVAHAQVTEKEIAE